MKILLYVLALAPLQLASCVLQRQATELDENESRRLRFEHPKFDGRSLLPDENGSLHVMVTYKNERGRLNLRGNSTIEGPSFESVSMEAITVSLDDLARLADDPDIDSIVEDFVVHAAGEATPYGIQMSQSSQPSDFRPSAAQTSNCDDENSFKIAIVDAGLPISHPDLPCAGSNSRCKGQSFGVSEPWDDPDYYHGAHVAGIMSAIANNNLGIKGMMGDNSDYCIIVVRALNDDGAGYMSRIMEGIEWAVQQGAKVINVSITGGGFVNSVNELFNKIYNDEGRLVVAAAGNDATSSYAYPASYESVISVGAVDKWYDHVWFSQTNNKVDFAAPGMQVLSTAPLGRGNEVPFLAVNNGETFAGKWFGNLVNKPPSDGLWGPLVQCSRDSCSGPGGHICVLERERKAVEKGSLNCEASGGIAAVYFEGEPDDRLNGNLKPTTTVGIPVALFTYEDGPRIMNSIGVYALLTNGDGYMYLDGTSMASPHVAGAAAAIWRACPSCSNKQVESCLASTVSDLGSAGRDNVFGAGLVQAKDALDCLKQQCC